MWILFFHYLIYLLLHDDSYFKELKVNIKWPSKYGKISILLEANHIRHSQNLSPDHIVIPEILPKITFDFLNICLKLETRHYNDLKYPSQLLKRTFPTLSPVVHFIF